MKAIQIQEFGGPDVLRVADVAPPEPGMGEVLVRTAAIGVNFADTRMRAGNYVHQPALPLTPGFEISGYIEAVGPFAEHLAPDPSLLVAGTPVVVGDAKQGYAQYALAPADLIYAVPAGKDVVDAAALPVNYLTAWCALHLKGRVRAGQTVLVHAAGGGVGSAAVQLAKIAGARVIATASSPDKLAHATRAGADYAVNYVSDSFVTQIRDLLGESRPVDLVLDSVGGKTLTDSLEVLGPWGRLVGFGQAGDTPAELDVYRSAIPQHLDLCFFARGALTSSRAPSDRALLQEAMSNVVDLWGSGAIEPLAVTRLPLSQAAEAHRRLGERSTIGKFVLDPEE